MQRITITAALFAASVTRRSSSPTASIRSPKSARKASLLAVAATKLTFRQATEGFIAQADAGWRSRKRATKYSSTLARYAWQHLGTLDVAAIDVPHVLAVLEQKVPASKGIRWHVARVRTVPRMKSRREGGPRHQGMTALN